MIEVKRNCSSSVTDRGDRITFGDITITISDENYIKFRELMNEFPERKPLELLGWLLTAELVA